MPHDPPTPLLPAPASQVVAHRYDVMPAAGTVVAAVAALGVVLLITGLTQRGAPAAAPLPPTSVATAATAVSIAPPSHHPPGRRISPPLWQPTTIRQPVPALTTRPDTPGGRRSPLPAGAASDSRPPGRDIPPVHGTPDTLSIPSLGQLNIPVTVATESASRVLEPPTDVHTVGLWASGSPLAARDGTTDLVGHVNYTGQGPGALHNIADLHRGDLLYTTDHHGAASTWTVNAVVARSKSIGVDTTAFAGPDGPRRLILITCGGAFDPAAQSYRSNVYVWAQPTTPNN